MLALLPALTLFTAVASFTPGPNNLMLMSSGLNFGFARTVPHLLGVNLGFTIMTLLVGLGLAELFVHAPILMVALKWAGAAYLIVLAIKIARSGPVKAGPSTGRPITFLQAAAFQWINPKAWIMAVTACAAYTLPEHYVASVLLVAAVFGAVGLPFVCVWAGFGVGLRRLLGEPGKQKAFNYTMAGLLIASLYPILTE